jgi:beta-phosphoglucomutase-like phosphatase (HAD superfamily)
MTMLAPAAAPLPAFTALLFGLSGCLVDFGAQAARQIIKATPGQPPRELQSQAEATPGALNALQGLSRQQIPCAWLDELPESVTQTLAAPLPIWIKAAPPARNPWPAPDACWQALIELKVAQLDGCVLISGDPRLLQSGLNAGLWTIGLASCGPLCGLSPERWQALPQSEREHLRGQATVQLYKLGVHSVIDHLGELEYCLSDIALRRSKGEKP